VRDNINDSESLAQTSYLTLQSCKPSFMMMESWDVATKWHCNDCIIVLQRDAALVDLSRI